VVEQGRVDLFSFWCSGRIRIRFEGGLSGGSSGVGRGCENDDEVDFNDREGWDDEG
jgi:hypothetical protein